VLDVEVSGDGVPYMVMEFLDGHDLSAELTQKGPMPISQAIDYVLQSCAAMREAHRLGIVHRDLKPSNLFLTFSEGKPVIKVLDFGISKVDDDREARVTGTQATVGTPLYMSPEQIRSAKHVDSRTDIWALGIILYELLTGKTPYEGSTTAAAVAICIDPVPTIRNVRPDVPPELEHAIMRALAKERELRFQTVDEFAQAIVPFAGLHSQVVSQPSIPAVTGFDRTEASGSHMLGAKRPGAATESPWSTHAGRRKATPMMWIVAVGLGLLGAGTIVTLVVILKPPRNVQPANDPPKTAITAATTATSPPPPPSDTTPTVAVTTLPAATAATTPTTTKTVVRPNNTTKPPPTTSHAPTTNVSPAPTPTRL
jgi:serine/threonine-protein kinase